MSIPKPVHILLATPCYGGLLHRGFFHSVLSLQRLCQIQGYQLTVHTLGNESLIQRGRNFYIALTLGNPHITHLLFVDSDITFNPENVIRMVQFQKGVVCGIYPKKGINWENMIQLSKEEGITKENIEKIGLEYVINFSEGNIQVENGFLKCLYAGTGFMLIQREVIEKLRDKHPETKFINDVGGYQLPETKDNFYALFDCFICPKSKRYLSEDYAFCQRALDSGFDIWVDITCNLTHTGTYNFEGSFGQYITFMHQMNQKKQLMLDEIKEEKTIVQSGNDEIVRW